MPKHKRLRVSLLVWMGLCGLAVSALAVGWTWHTRDAAAAAQLARIELYYPLRGRGFYRIANTDGTLVMRTRKLTPLNAANATARALPMQLRLDVTDRESEFARRSARQVVVTEDLVALRAMDAAVYEPPLPLLPVPPALGAKVVREGTFHNAPYRAVLTVEAHEERWTEAGYLKDCVRVKLELTLHEIPSSSTSWYCARVGLAQQDDADAAGTVIARTLLLDYELP